MPDIPSRPRILLVDDEVSNLQALERTLRADFDVVCHEDPRQALAALESEEFSAIISDLRMPQMQGTELLEHAARIRPLTTRLVLTAHTESQTILEAINRAQIYRYITKPWDNLDLVATLRQACERYALRRENERLLEKLREANRTLEAQVAERTEELSQANQRLSELAMTDSLTRVANRRALLARFQDEIDRAERYARPITIALYDVDHFKVFNDMEGHLCGDEALKKIAAVMASNLRKTDFLARYGGEEFIVLMPETSLAAGNEIAVRLRTAVENTVFRGKTEQAYLTVSAGLAAFPKHGQTSKALFEAADQALYLAKDQGRNRIVVAH